MAQTRLTDRQLLASKLAASDGSPDPVLSSDAAGALTAIGALTVGGTVTAGNNNLKGSSATIADDNVTSFTPSNSLGVILMFARSSVAAQFCALAVYFAAASPIMVSIGTLGTNTELTTGALAGTTGTDGKVTLSAHTDGKIYIENRRGGNTAIGWVLFGN